MKKIPSCILFFVLCISISNVAMAAEQKNFCDLWNSEKDIHSKRMLIVGAMIGVRATQFIYANIVDKVDAEYNNKTNIIISFIDEIDVDNIVKDFDLICSKNINIHQDILFSLSIIRNHRNLNDNKFIENAKQLSMDNLNK